MRFTCLQENLSKGLSTVSKAIPTKGSLPILSNVLICAKDGRLKLSATDFDTSISLFVGASVEEEGVVTVPAKLIGEFVSHLSPSTITGELKGTILHLITEKTKSKFNGTDPVEYPELPKVKKGALVLDLDPKEFSSAVLSVAFSAAMDDSRPVLAGILLNFSSGALTVVSADGFRLSEKLLNVGGKISDFNVVLPAKTLVEVARVLGGSDEDIRFVLNEDENLALFESEEILISTRIINGKFPDYKKLIPADTSLKANFSTEDLLQAVRLTNVFAKEIHSAITMVFSTDGFIKLTSVSPETGEHHSEIEAEVDLKDGELKVVFNSKFLLDFLNNIKSERIAFGTNGNLTPGVIKPMDSENYVHIIMPIRDQS